MTGRQIADGSGAFEASEEDSPSSLEAETQPALSERPGQWPKDHCDYLLDTIDAQLDQMQSNSNVLRGSSAAMEDVDPHATVCYRTEMEGQHENALIGTSVGTSINTIGLDEDKNDKKEEYKWRLTQLLGSEETGNMGYQSDANSVESVCTEDFVSKFREGMVDPKIKSNGKVNNENALFHGFGLIYLDEHKSDEPSDSDMSVGIEDLNTISDTAAGDTFGMSMVHRQDIVQRFKDELEDSLQVTVSTSSSKKVRNRTNSLESLGGRISRLSQTNVSELQSLLCEEQMSTVESHNLSEDKEELQASVDSETRFSHNECIPVNLRRDGTVKEVFSGELQHQQKTSLPPRFTLAKEDEVDSCHQSRSSDTELAKVHSNDLQTLQEAPEKLENLLTCDSSSASSSLKIVSNGPSLASQTDLMLKSTSMDYADNFESVRQHNNLKVSEELDHTSEVFGDDNHLTKSSEHIHKYSLTANNTEQSYLSETFDGSLEISSNHEECVEGSTEISHCRMQNPSIHTRIIAITDDSEAGFTDQNNSTFHQQYLLDRKKCTLSTSSKMESRSTEPFIPHFNLESTLKEEHTDTNQCKHLAGVPVMNFDGVVIDSDLDSVRTEKVRAHFRKAIGDRKGTGRNARRLRCPRKDSQRHTNANKTPTDGDDDDGDVDDDDEKTHQPTFASPAWRNSSPVQWSTGCNRAANSSWDCTEHLPAPFLQRFGSSVEELAAERERLVDSVSKLQREIHLEEERLSQRRLRIREADQSLSDFAHQKKEMLQDLESLRHALDISERDVKKSESRMKESQSKVDERRTELALLEFRRDTDLKELQELELELSAIRRQCSSAHSSHLTAFQSEVSSLVAERDELKVRLRHMEASISFMERQELERQLTNAKAELLSEQRTARAKMEELQKRLEELQSKTADKTAEGALLQEKVLQLSAQLQDLERKSEDQIQMQAVKAGKEQQALNQQIKDLTAQVSEQKIKIAGLEKILSEKELEFLRLREVISTLGAEKEAQVTATGILKEEHSRRLVELHIEKNHEKELQMAELRKELQCSKQQELQQFADSMEQIKNRALTEQTASFEKEKEKLMKIMESKDEEMAKLKEGIQLQKVTMKKLVGELKHEAKEMVQSSLIREQKRFEADKREALHMQRESLKEERHRALTAMNEALEREHRTSQSLQNKAVELQTRIQEQELHSRALQRQKEEALEELSTALREEKLVEVKMLREELEQEHSREVDRLKERHVQLEEELRLLQAEQSEATFREKELQAQVERAERSLVREVSSVCERLQEPLQSMLGRTKATSPSRHGSPSRLSSRHVLQMLNGLSEETNQYIQELRQEVEAQKRTVFHIQREKERELKQQREQNHLEKEAALDVLKERLIQEHIEEITNLQRSQLRESGSGDNQTLRQQLREKDNELRAIQRNMARWKDETACKLARKFEEELNAELEKRFSRNKPISYYRNTEMLDSDLHKLSMQEKCESSPLRSASSPSLNSPVVPGQHDFGALKMLRKLQGRVRDLRAESTACHVGSMEDLSTLRGDLGSTYREKRHKLLDHSFSQFMGASGRK